MRRLTFPLLTLLLLGCPVEGDDDAAEPPHPHPSVEGLALPMVVGHGGAKHLCAANTLECFEHALSVGAVALEADLQVLGDGTLVMFHDGNTAEQCGEDHDLAELTLAQFQQLDAGWGFSPDGGETYPLRGQGLVAPTFAAFLDQVRDVPVLLDVKTGEPPMNDAIRAFVSDDLPEQARTRVYFKVKSQSLAEELRALEPAPFVAFTTGERALLLVDADSVDLPPSWIDLNPPELQADLVTWAHEHDHLFTASTINETDEMSSLLEDHDLDGIVTDRPDLLAALLP